MAGLVKSILSIQTVLIAIVVLVVLAPIIKPGFFSVHDETHIVDVYQMYRSLELGGFPPRFAPDFNFGLGYPYFNFYYHLPFYVTSSFHFLGFSFVDSFKYMMGLAVIIAASGFYFFLRNHVEKTAATIGTLIYILSPYFAVDLYVRGAFGELFLLGFLPWCGFLLYKYLTKPTYLNLGIASIPVFLISISHNVLLPFVYSLLFLYGVANLIILKAKLSSYLKLFLPFILGACLGAYYLLPAFYEVQYVSTYEQFNLADHFPFLKQLIIPHWGYGPSIWGFLDDISFDIGTVNLILVLISLFIFKLAKREVRILLVFFWMVFGLAVVLMNSRTLFFWESIRFLRLVQFPWRMLLITTISTSFIAALVFEVISEKYKASLLLRNKKVFPILFILTIGILLALNIWHYRPSEFKNITDERYLELYLANRTLEGSGERGNLSPEYLNFTEDFIPPTIWQAKRPEEILDEVKLASASGTVSFIQDGLDYDIAYRTGQADTVLISKAYFPGWEAKSNSATLKVEPATDYGIIGIKVPAGEGSLQLSFQNTPVRTLANSVSAVSGLSVLVLLIYPVVRKIKK